MDASLFDFGISMAHDLDAQFNKNKVAVYCLRLVFVNCSSIQKTVLSQRDVPGMTRSVVPLLVKRGVRGITVGVNDGSAPPAVPKIFLWRDKATSTDVSYYYYSRFAEYQC